MIVLPLVLLQFIALAAPNEIYLDRANNFAQGGDVAAAEAALETALNHDPKDIEALEALVFLRCQLGLHEQCVASSRRLLSLDPYNDDVRFFMGRSEAALGRQREAELTIANLIQRHPTHEQGLALKDSMPTASDHGLFGQSLQPIARLGLQAGYDSNVALDALAVPDASRTRGAVAAVDAIAGVSLNKGNRPIEFLVRLFSQSSLENDSSVDLASPTFIEAALAGQLYWNEWEFAGDLRYNELFVDRFAEHRQRLVAPSLWLSHPFGAFQKLRLLGGVEYRQPTATGESYDNLTTKVAMRDTFYLGHLNLVLDIGARRNFRTEEMNDADIGALASPTYRTSDFGEVFGSVYGEYDVLKDATAYARGEVSGREFYAGGPQETTYMAVVGLRYFFGHFEAFGDYGYTRNVADELRSYERHAVSAGLRFWY